MAPLRATVYECARLRCNLCGEVPRSCGRGASEPHEIVALADTRAQQRVCRRLRRMMLRGMPRNKIVVAIARELVGYLWVALHMVHAREA